MPASRPWTAIADFISKHRRIARLIAVPAAAVAAFYVSAWAGRRASMILCFLLAQAAGLKLWLQFFDRPALKWPLRLVFLLFNLGWLHFLLLYDSGEPTGASWPYLGRPSLAWQAFHVMAITLIAAPAAILLEALAALSRALNLNKKTPRPPAAPGRRAFLKTAAAAGLLGATGLAGYGVFRQGRPPRLVNLTITFSDLPPALDGFAIAHITDTHVGLWSNQDELRQALSAAAAARPDLVVLTGDLVDRDPEFARLYHEPLGLLAGTPHGVWGVLGNHDHYAGPERIAELLDGRGLSMLVDRRVNLPNLPLSLTGLDDQGRSSSWLGHGHGQDREELDFQALAGPPPRPGDFSILLNHRPEGFAQAIRAGYPLYLAGHTHGGQYQLPGASQINLAAGFYKYSSGLYREGDAYIHVSRGVASVGPPFRLFAWPEINILTLKKA